MSDLLAPTCRDARGARRSGQWRHHLDMTEHLTAARLRGIPSLTGEPRSLALDDLPVDPAALFVGWLEDAIEAGVAEPHAATLATVDRDGMPDARTLILKGLDERGWAVAGSRSSRKGEQLAVQPAAALNFWWQPIMRAVRVRGLVEEASRADSEADLAARSATARVGIDPDEWVLWRIHPVRAEFWQGALDRSHRRVVYTRTNIGWSIDRGDGQRENADSRNGDEQ